ncbi:hypothetical protein QBC37DRAFT_157694 [Rhypophila decipiens]|uniref:Uncharacterized protein n=1 Tax=Rhypophila decipiens TaxID=261697 RepID=A0AAN7BAV8_9PEZI|nr:hypothetical protein QBC37DRAFT_157694 [Rhypophila decipiens]
MRLSTLWSISVVTIFHNHVIAYPAPQFGSYLGDCKTECSYPNMQLVCQWPTLYCAMPGNFVITPVGTCDQCSVFATPVPAPAKPN